MSRHVKSRLLRPSSKSARSTYSMHKGSVPVQRKRKPSAQSPNEHPKKRRVARNSSDVQSGSGLRDGIVPRLTERQQLALAMEESKKAAAALQAKGRQASRPLSSEDEGSDVPGASDSEQDSVSEDESAIKPHRRPTKPGQPARSLTSQHSDVASQLGQHNHQLCAKSGRLESLSGTSKQSHSSSSKLRLTADSSNQPATSSRLLHIDSDADSHPSRANSKCKSAVSDKSSPFAERQRTSDLSSRDVLDAVEESKVKDEMQSEAVASIRLPLEDGMDLLDKRTQRLALRKAVSQGMQLYPQAHDHMSLSEASDQMKPQQSKTDLFKDGSTAPSKQNLKTLKVRVKPEAKADKNQQLNGLDSPAAAEFVQQQRRHKQGSQTPRDHHVLGPDAAPRPQNGLQLTPRPQQLSSRPSAPMAQLVESDLFGDFSSSKSGLEQLGSLPSASPRLPIAAIAAQQQTPAALVPEADQAVKSSESQPRPSLKVTLKHRLSVSNAAPARLLDAAAADEPSLPPKLSLMPSEVAVGAGTAVQDQLDGPVASTSTPANKALKRKTGKPGRPRTVNRVPSREPAKLRSPAADASCQEMGAAVPMLPPETDAQLLQPSPAAKGRGKGRKAVKPPMALQSIGSRRLRSTASMEEDGVKAFLSYDSRKPKASALLTAAAWLNNQQDAWAAWCHSRGAPASAQGRQQPGAGPYDSMLQQADASRRGATLLLQAAATVAIADAKAQHELEGKLLTHSMMLPSDQTAAEVQRLQEPTQKQVAEAGSRGQDVHEPPASFAAALSGLWKPYVANKDNDKWFGSQRWTRDELAFQEVRSPRRSTSHRAYDSGWDDLQARQTSEMCALQAVQNWRPQ